MNLVKTIIIGVSLSASIVSASTITEDQIARVDGTLQIVGIKGPSAYFATKAAILKSVNGKPEIVIFGNNGTETDIISKNSNLTITLEDQDNSGFETTISSNKPGSLIVTTYFRGRYRGEQNLVVAYRDNKYILAGYTKDVLDTVENKEEKCEYNLLAGKGLKNGKRVKVKKEKIEFSQLVDDGKFSSCNGW